MMDEKELERRVRNRIDDWFYSTSEYYAGPVGSEDWRRGLVNYIVYGPDSLTDESE